MKRCNDDSVSEIGWEADLRFAVALVDQPVVPTEAKNLKKDSTYIVSGGTAGIIYPVLMDLVHHARGRFILLGRTSLPDINNENIKLLITDRDALKKAISQTLTTAGQKATPVAIEQHLSVLERASSTT